MELNQYKLEVRKDTLMDDEQKAMAIAEANALINTYRGTDIEKDVEKKRKQKKIEWMKKM